MINVDAGKKVEDLICDDCKQKIREKTSEIMKKNKLALLSPNRLAQSMAKCLCKECRTKVLARLKK